MALTLNNKEALNEEIEKNHHLSTILNIHAHVEDKNRFARFRLKQHALYQEAEELGKIHQAKEDAAIREKNLQRENELAKAMDKMKREEIIQIKLRQQLRENTPELRDLERQLRKAYTNKELVAQIAQKEAERVNERIQEQRSYDILKTAWVTEDELRHQTMVGEIGKKAQYKQELQDQIILQEKARRHQYEEFLREKKVLDDIIQRIHDEDERLIADKMCRVQKTHQEIIAFREAQKRWKEKKREELEEENRKIQEYLLSKAADVSARETEKKRIEALKEQMSENIAKQIYEETRKKQERDEIIADLLEEEQKEAIDKRHREEVEKQIRLRIDVRESLLKQMEDRQERKRQEAEEDTRYKEQLLEELANQRKLDQLSEQKKRMKMLQLRREVEEMMNERRRKYAESMQLQKKLEEEEEKEIEERKRIIEGERIKMLQDHVKNLIGYLPKGILKPTDLPHLGDELTKQIKTADKSTIHTC